jgi:hypothetical protein
VNFKAYYENSQLHGRAEKEGVTVQDVDSTELQKGIKVEHEHTADEATAKKIALDHLAEDPHYYTKLLKAKL